MKRFITKLMVAFAVVGLLAVSAVPAVGAQGPSKADVCEGVAAAGASCTPDANSTTVSDVIEFVVNTLSTVIGVVAVIMIMIGGFKYVTSGGDSASISSAKNTILYAIVGIIVVAMAQIIVQFVVGTV